MSNEPDIILTGPRLLLRRHRPDDVDALVALWTDPDVTLHMGGPRDAARVRKSLEDAARHPERDTYDLWPVVERTSGQVIGHCGLLDKEVDGAGEIELVYVIARAYWGRGYATEIARGTARHAFTSLGLERLIALITPENAASERVAVKVGMRYDHDTVRPGGNVRRVYAMRAAGSDGP